MRYSLRSLKFTATFLVETYLAGFRKNLDVSFDPSNFLYTRTYGQAPSDTTLTITYTTGNGISDNVLSNTQYIKFFYLT